MWNIKQFLKFVVIVYSQILLKLKLGKLENKNLHLLFNFYVIKDNSITILLNIIFGSDYIEKQLPEKFGK